MMFWWGKGLTWAAGIWMTGILWPEEYWWADLGWLSPKFCMKCISGGVDGGVCLFPRCLPLCCGESRSSGSSWSKILNDLVLGNLSSRSRSRWKCDRAVRSSGRVSSCMNGSKSHNFVFWPSSLTLLVTSSVVDVVMEASLPVESYVKPR